MTDWAAIETDDAYLADMELLKEVIADSLGIKDLVDETDLRVIAAAHYLSLARHFTRQIPLQSDIDSTGFIDLIANEVGLTLPSVSAIPLVEFLRENKRFYGHKGSEILYDFIGAIVGSPIEIHYPRDLIFTLDTLRSALDGDASTSGRKKFKESRLAHLRDGIFWAKYTYVISVLQGQLIENYTDLINLIKSIHPAGTKYFLDVLNWNVIDQDLYLDRVCGSYQKDRHYFYAYYPYPGLDNGFCLDTLNSKLDMLGGDNWVGQTWIRESRENVFPWYRVIAHDTLMHQYPAGKPDGCFFKWAPSTDDLYIKVYADEDPEIMAIQQTNMSFSELTYEDLENRDFREFEHIAWDQEGQNPSTEWYRDLPLCTIVES